MTIRVKYIKISLWVTILATTFLQGMNHKDYLTHLNTLTAPTMRIHTIMRKYHQYNIPHSQENTRNDINELQNICSILPTLTPSQQQHIIDEIIGISLFILFFTHPFIPQSTYIDTILSSIDQISSHISHPPHFDQNVEHHPFCQYLTQHWKTLSPHEQLIIKELANVQNACFFFNIPYHVTPAKFVRRLIIFLLYTPQELHIQNSHFQSRNAFKETMEYYTLCYRKTNHWKFFYKQLEKDPRLDFIITDDVTHLVHNQENRHIFYDPEIIASYHTRISKLTDTNPNQAINYQSRNYINHIVAAALLGAHNVFSHIFYQYNQNLFNHQHLFYAAHIGGDETIISMVAGSLDKEDIIPWYTKDFYKEACSADNSNLCFHIKAYGYANNIAPFNNIQNIFSQQSITSPAIINNTDEIVHTIQYATSDTTYHQYAHWALTERSAIPEQLLLQRELSSILFYQHYTPALTAILTYIHKKLPFNNRLYAIKKHALDTKTYDQHVIQHIKSFFEQHAQDTSTTHYVLNTIIGILIHDIFFVTPYVDVQTYVDTIIQSIPQLTTACSHSTKSVSTYKKLFPSLGCILKPHDALILNTLSPTTINLIKQPLSAIIMATKLSLFKTYAHQFYTLDGFKQFIQRLEIATLCPASLLNPLGYDKTINTQDGKLFHILSNRTIDTIKLTQHLNDFHKQHCSSKLLIAGLIGDPEYFQNIYHESTLQEKRENIHEAINGGNQQCIDISLASLNNGHQPSLEELNEIAHTAILNNNYFVIQYLIKQFAWSLDALKHIPSEIIFCYPLHAHLYKKQYHDNPHMQAEHLVYAQTTGAYPTLARMQKLFKGHTNKENVPYLFPAIISNNQELIDHILYTTPQEDWKKLFKSTSPNDTLICIQAASKKGNLDIIKKILDTDPNYATSKNNFKNLILYTLLNQHSDVLEYLITYNQAHHKHSLIIDDLFNINRTEPIHHIQTFLKKLATNNQKKIFKLLIQHDLCILNNNSSPRNKNIILFMMLAQAMKNKSLFASILKKIEKKYPTIDWINEKIPSPYIFPRTHEPMDLTLAEYAIEKNKLDVFNWLLENKKDFYSSDLLLIAIKQEQYEIIEHIAPMYMSPHYFESSSHNPIAICLSRNNEHALMIMCEAFIKQKNPNLPVLSCLINEVLKQIGLETNDMKMFRIATNNSIRKAMRFIFEEKKWQLPPYDQHQENIFHALAKKNLAAEDTEFFIRCIIHYTPHEQVALMLQDTYDITIKSPLMYAIEYHNKNFLEKIMLHFPIDGNKRYYQENGNTLLHMAINQQTYTCIYFLIKHGCSLDIPNNDGITAMNILQALVQSSNIEIKDLKEQIEICTQKINTLKGNTKKTHEVALINLNEKLKKQCTTITHLNTIYTLLPEKKNNQQDLVARFFYALEKHDSQTISLLIQQGLDLLNPHQDGNPLIFNLCDTFWNQQIIHLLCSLYPPITVLLTKNKQKTKLIKHIAWRQDIPLLKTFLEECPHNNHFIKMLIQLLYSVIKRGLLQVVMFMHQQNIINFDDVDNHQINTILQHAIINKQEETAHYLIDHHCCALDWTNKNYMNAYMLAIEYECPSVAQHIEVEYAQKGLLHPLAQDRIAYNNNLIHAIKINYRHLVRAYVKNLKAYNIDINFTSYDEPKSALHIAVENNDQEFVHLLLSHGAHPNNNSKTGKIPLVAAIQKGHHELIDILLNITYLDVKDKDLNTLAHVAAKHKNIKVLQALHAKNISLTQKNKRQYTPLDIAQRLAESPKKQEIITFLQNH